MAAVGTISTIGKSKSKVDNLYRSSKQSRSLQNRYYNIPLVHWTHEWLPHTGALAWKPSQGTKLYCLVNRGTLVWTTCQGRCPTMQWPGIEPTTCRSRVHRPNHNTTEYNYWYSQSVFTAGSRCDVAGLQQLAVVRGLHQYMMWTSSKNWQVFIMWHQLTAFHGFIHSLALLTGSI